jgi:hypothetical protein
MKYDLKLDHPSRRFLADQPRHHDSGKAHDRAATSSRQASVLIAIAAAICIAIVLLQDRVDHFSVPMASLVGNSALRPSTDLSTPTIQFTTDVRILPASAQEPSIRGSTAALESVGQDQAEGSEPSSEVLLKQFQVWAAEQDAQKTVGPVGLVQDAQTSVDKNASPPSRHMQKHRQVRSAYKPQAETPIQNAQNIVRRPQIARAPIVPPQDIRAQVQLVQSGPSLLQTFGLRN